MNANSYLEIDLNAIRENVLQIREEIGPGKKLIPVVKGNGYGLGAVPLARFLGEMEGIDTFAVSHVSEGIELRRAGITQDIMVISLPLDDQIPEAIRNHLILTLGSFRQFPLFQKASELAGGRLSVQLKLDTGLHRIGFLPEETEMLCRAIRENASWLDLYGTFSHFSCDEPEQLKTQAECFDAFLRALHAAGIDPGLCHLSSSGSMEVSKDYLYDAVRIGRRLTLDSPVSPSGKIREAVSYRAFLTDVRMRRAGDTLAYGGKFRLEKDTRVGVLSVGYGDGLPHALSAVHAPVLIGGQRCPLLASCMCQSFVDLGEVPCEAGDEVTLFGHDTHGCFLPAQEVASLIGLEGCDMTTVFTDRVARVYLK